MEIVKNKIDRDFLPFVRQPGRYIGGEINQIKKDLNACDVAVALCFPDIYEIGMSHTGLAILYNVLNSLDKVAAERVYAPWTDAEQVMRDNKVPLYSLENSAAVQSFDIIGFSLTNELCYTNMLNMLDLAGLKVRSADRGENDPIIVVGGQASNNGEPIAPFVDLFILGEGEEAIVELVNLYRKMKSAGTTKRDILIAAAKQFDYVYVPSLYDYEYDGDTITALTPMRDDIPTHFHNAVVKDFDNAPMPEAPIVPFVQAVHERISVEVMRGCPGRCRFCQASFCRRPIRFRSVDRIVDIAKKNYEATGYDTVSLLSLSTADYPYLEELLEKLNAYFIPKQVGVSVPSLKVQKQLQLLPKLVSTVRKKGLTIAVEAASEKLRRVINKPIKNEDLFAALRAAYAAGFQSVKLYFMVGFPGETETDIRDIVDLANEISALRKEHDNKLAAVNIAVSWLVPKPHTPFAWMGQKSADYFTRAKRIILDRKSELKNRWLKFKFHDLECSVLESAMGRGDRRLADVIETAWQNGARFDLWSECFDYPCWTEAFAEHNMNLHEAAEKSFVSGQRLPWAHLGGPREAYIENHYNNAIEIANEH